ncbi:hypothetical protein [Duganella sp. HH101]|uniref:hypothetical protein n=1 Tax=Duganella sp. HH101 TaxID=1781066 RepID=UPI0008934C50|nr:hypothetical protein [Duganella sp. HH101]OFA04536.1 hypothetical protein DUGA2_20820 [Duganella sp. HH101]
MLTTTTKLEQQKKSLYISAVLIALSLTLILFLSHVFSRGEWHLASISEVLQKLPTAVTLTFFAWVAINKWLWKYKPFSSSLALGIPILEGTWTGHLESDWSPGKVPSASPQLFPIVFCIRQTALALTVTSFTKDRTGRSNAAELIGNESAATLHMAYMYTLADSFSPGLGAQHGAGYVEITSANPRELRGTYWTSTKTHGRIILVHRTKKCFDSYTSAIASFPVAQWKKF